MRTLDWKRENPSHGKSGPGAKIRCSNGHIVAVIKGDAALDVARSMVKKSICQECGDKVLVPIGSKQNG